MFQLQMYQVLLFVRESIRQHQNYLSEVAEFGDATLDKMYPLGGRWMMSSETADDTNHVIFSWIRDEAVRTIEPETYWKMDDSAKYARFMMVYESNPSNYLPIPFIGN